MAIKHTEPTFDHATKTWNLGDYVRAEGTPQPGWIFLTTEGLRTKHVCSDDPPDPFHVNWGGWVRPRQFPVLDGQWNLGNDYVPLELNATVTADCLLLLRSGTIRRPAVRDLNWCPFNGTWGYVCPVNPPREPTQTSEAASPKFKLRIPAGYRVLAQDEECREGDLDWHWGDWGPWSRRNGVRSGEVGLFCRKIDLPTGWRTLTLDEPIDPARARLWHKREARWFDGNTSNNLKFYRRSDDPKLSFCTVVPIDPDVIPPRQAELVGGATLRSVDLGHRHNEITAPKLLDVGLDHHYHPVPTHTVKSVLAKHRFTCRICGKYSCNSTNHTRLERIAAGLEHETFPPDARLHEHTLPPTYATDAAPGFRHPRTKPELVLTYAPYDPDDVAADAPGALAYFTRKP